MSALDPRARAVLDYWFGDLAETPRYFAERNRLWFGGAAETDAHIRSHFESDVTAAAEGWLAAWEATPKGCMALIVLLDQFSLNLYREQPRSYQQSELAIPLAERAIARGWERQLTCAERAFLYLPFEHSEKLPDQERSVALFEALVREAPPALKPAMEDAHHWAVRHWRVVARFGRFPDRNEVFGRPSRPEELAFLASDEAPF
jgi:uncharacterized protein (DUF924 family)